MIEIAAAGAGHVSVDGVEDLASLLVGVEALINEVSEETPALRDAESIRAFRCGCRVRIVFAVRHEIANGGQTASDDRRIPGGVNDLVDFSRNESAVEMDRRRISKPPVSSRNRDAWRRRCVPLRQGALHRRGGISGAADRTLNHMSDRM